MFGWQAFFIALGTIAAAAAPALVIEWMGEGSDRRAFSWIAVTIGTLLVALYGLLVWKVPERAEFASRESNPLVPGVRRALRNRPFRIIFLAGLMIDKHEHTPLTGLFDDLFDGADCIAQRLFDGSGAFKRHGLAFPKILPRK